MSFKKDRKKMRQMDTSRIPADQLDSGEEGVESRRETELRELIAGLDHARVLESFCKGYMELVHQILEGNVHPGAVMEISPAGYGKLLLKRSMSQGQKIENRRARRARTLELAVIQGDITWSDPDRPPFREEILSGWYHDDHGKIVERDGP